jgi:hypothetical protein
VRIKNCLTQNFLEENIIFTDGNQEKFWVIKRYMENDLETIKGIEKEGHPASSSPSKRTFSVS